MYLLLKIVMFHCHVSSSGGKIYMTYDIFRMQVAPPSNTHKGRFRLFIGIYKLPKKVYNDIQGCSLLLSEQAKKLNLLTPFLVWGRGYSIKYNIIKIIYKTSRSFITCKAFPKPVLELP